MLIVSQYCADRVSIEIDIGEDADGVSIGGIDLHSTVDAFSTHGSI